MLWRPSDRALPGNDGPSHQVVLRYTADGSNLVNDMIIYVGVNSRDGYLFMRPTINLAVSSGELRLQSTDPTDQPILDYRYFSDPFDLRRQRDAVRFCMTLARTRGFESLIDAGLEPSPADLESDPALDEWILREADTGHHSAGTCKMGPADDPLAVVDQWGSVHGIENLSIVDASIMPDCVRANINAAVLMIGERIAENVRKDVFQ